jgi:hypothetical protein
MTGFEIRDHERDLPLIATRLLGEQLLETMVPGDGVPLPEKTEELVFCHPEGVGNIEPGVISGFVEQFYPAADPELYSRGWVLTAGRVASVHAHWQTGHDPSMTGATVQVRGLVVGGVQQAVELGVQMEGVIDKEVCSLLVKLGDIGSRGHVSGPIMGLSPAELSGEMPDGCSNALTDLIEGVRSAFTTADVHFAPQRYPRLT